MRRTARQAFRRRRSRRIPARSRHVVHARGRRHLAAQSDPSLHPCRPRAASAAWVSDRHCRHRRPRTAPRTPRCRSRRPRRGRQRRTVARSFLSPRPRRHRPTRARAESERVQAGATLPRASPRPSSRPPPYEARSESDSRQARASGAREASTPTAGRNDRSPPLSWLMELDRSFVRPSMPPKHVTDRHDYCQSNAARRIVRGPDVFEKDVDGVRASQRHRIAERCPMSSKLYWSNRVRHSIRRASGRHVHRVSDHQRHTRYGCRTGRLAIRLQLPEQRSRGRQDGRLYAASRSPASTSSTWSARAVRLTFTSCSASPFASTKISQLRS